MKELHAFYREILVLDDYAERLGDAPFTRIRCQPFYTSRDTWCKRARNARLSGGYILLLVRTR